MPTVPIALAAQIVAVANQVVAAPAPLPSPTPTPTPTPAPTPTPTPIPGLLNDIGPGGSFAAANGDVWSIAVQGQYNLVMLNGARAAGMLATRVVEQADHAIKALRTTGSWQLWNGSGWNQTSAPA